MGLIDAESDARDASSDTIGIAEADIKLNTTILGWLDDAKSSRPVVKGRTVDYKAVRESVSVMLNPP